MADPNLPLLEDAASKLTTFLDEIVFVGRITLGLLITDTSAAPMRGTIDVDVIAEIFTYADSIEFSERLRKSKFTEDAGEPARGCWRMRPMGWLGGTDSTCEHLRLELRQLIRKPQSSRRPHC